MIQKILDGFDYKTQMYSEFADGINTVFYDANAVIGLVFGEEEAAAGKLVEAIREQARMHTVSERSERSSDFIVITTLILFSHSRVFFPRQSLVGFKFSSRSYSSGQEAA